MHHLLTRIIGDTKEWKAMEARAARLLGTTSYQDRWRASLNDAVAGQLAE